MRDGFKWVARRRTDALAGVVDRLEHLPADHYRNSGCIVEHVGTGATARRLDACAVLAFPMTTRRPPPFRIALCGAPRRGFHFSGCRSLVVADPRTGAVTDRCAGCAIRREPSAAEVREARRKADAAIDVLRDSTPEM